MDRDALVQLALSYDLCSAGDDRERYAALVAVGEAPDRLGYFVDPHTSGCALTVRGLWLRMGVDDPRVRAPYHVGKAVENVVGIAKDFGAWHPPPRLSDPVDPYYTLPLRPGDMFVITNPEHVGTVVDVEGLDNGTWRVTSVDGGQRDGAGQQQIAKRVRIWHEQNGHTYADSRPVLGWADVGMIDATPCPATDRTS